LWLAVPALTNAFERLTQSYVSLAYVVVVAVVVVVVVLIIAVVVLIVVAVVVSAIVVVVVVLVAAAVVIVAVVLVVVVALVAVEVAVIIVVAVAVVEAAAVVAVVAYLFVPLGAKGLFEASPCDTASCQTSDLTPWFVAFPASSRTVLFHACCGPCPFLLTACGFRSYTSTDTRR
jgi:hypothetical protein